MNRCKSALSAALVVALGFAFTPNVHAGSVAGTGGSTEVTQIMNNIELIKQAMSQAETVENTLQSARYLKNTLQQMDVGTLSRMMGVPVEQVRAMARMQEQLSGLMDSEKDVSDRLDAFRSGAERQNVTPAQYLDMLADRATRQGGIYQKSLDEDQASIKALQDQIQSIQSTAASAPGITSQVGGLQALLTSNTQMQSQLVSMNQAMVKSNTLAALRYKQEAGDEASTANAFKSQRAAAAKLQDVKIELPDASQYAPGAKD